MSSLTTRVISNAMIQSYRDPIVAPPPRGFHGGLVLSDNYEDRLLRHNRYRIAVDEFDGDSGFSNRLKGEAVYGGPIWDHFGHFMSEMIHRIIPSRKEFGNHNFVFVTTTNDRRLDEFHKFPRFIKDILKFLKVDGENVNVINQNCYVDTLYVAEQGSDLGGGPKDCYLDILQDFSERRLREVITEPSTYSKVYVSRTGNRPGGHFLGEMYFESLLSRAGYLIFKPEEFEFSRQIDLYRQSDVLIFPEGSACHGTELLGRNMIGRCLLLDRHSNPGPVFSNILECRSEQFKRFNCGLQLGTAVREQATGNPAAHVGVSLFDLVALNTFLQSHNFGDLAPFSVEQYLEIAELDLLNYIRYHIQAGNRMCEPTDIAALFLAFAEAKKTLLNSR